MKKYYLFFLGIVLFCAETMGQERKTLPNGTVIEITNDGAFGSSNIAVIESPDYNPQFAVCFEAAYETTVDRAKKCANLEGFEKTRGGWNKLSSRLLTIKLNTKQELIATNNLKDEIINLSVANFSEESKIFDYTETIKQTSDKNKISKYNEKIKTSQNIITNNTNELNQKYQKFKKTEEAARRGATKAALENCDCSEEEKQIKRNFMNELEKAEAEIQYYLQTNK